MNEPSLNVLPNPATRLESRREAVCARLLGAGFLSDGVAVRAVRFAAAAAQAGERWQALENAISVCELLLDISADEETLAAGLLGSAIPEKDRDYEMWREAFGLDVVALVRGLTRAGRIESLTTTGSDVAATELLRKMLLAMADDVRVVLIKLAERAVYMRSITRADAQRQQAAAALTRELFAPLANRLGVFQIKWELEDLSFRFADPALYKRIAGFLDGKRSEREHYIRDVVAGLEADLKQLGLSVEVAGRPKHIWSIHRKMQSKGLAFEQLYDVRAVRVLVPSIADCYTVLAYVHDKWQAIAGEFDDYIAQPKANNYQSLHTAVIGPQGKTLEVQIRTREMHEASEHGVAAHWRYKEGGRSADKAFESKIAWLRQVLEWNRELVDQSGFSDAVKQGLFNDTIYVFTPQGRVIDLPAGATPVDFAYHVHTDLGHRCRGAKVDGHIVPLNTALKNAQVVDILAAKVGGPSRDWLNPQHGFLVSSRGQAKVRAWFRQEYFEVDKAHGRQILDREVARHGAGAIALEKIALGLGFRELDEALAAIGRGDVSPHQLEVALRGLTSPAANNEQQPIETFSLAQSKASHASDGVLVLGVNNIATVVAKCCKPLPSDPIIGFVTKTRGVMVHRIDCANITGLDAEQRRRLMPAQWGTTGNQTFSTDIEVAAQDRQGLLRDISEALSKERINVVGVNTLSKGNLASMRFTIEVREAEAITRVLRAVAAVSGVESVTRR